MTSWMLCILLPRAIETLTLNIYFFIKRNKKYIPNCRVIPGMVCSENVHFFFLVLNGYASSVGLIPNFNSLGYIFIDNSRQANDSAYCMKSDYGSSNL